MKSVVPIQRLWNSRIYLAFNRQIDKIIYPMFPFITDELEELRSQGLLRRPRTISAVDGPRVKINGRWYISFCTNDYLGLAQHKSLRQAARETISRFGWGAGASRLLAGTYTWHEQLETQIARYKKSPAALVFTSGYMANLGVINTLISRNDYILCDELNHASLVDAVRLTKAPLYIYKHRDMNDLERGLKVTQRLPASRLGRGSPLAAGGHQAPRTFIISDAVFSMDGDLASLPEIVRLARKYRAYTIIDDAHGTGIMGRTGRGTTEHFRLEHKIDVLVGTLSKAIGSIGGFVVGDKVLIEYLRNKARPFIFTTALPMAACAASIAALEIIQTRPVLRKRLWNNTRYVKSRLIKSGLDLRGSETPIIPVMIGDEKRALKAAQYLWKKGLFIPAIRPPTVPKGQSRLRITITAMHTKKELDLLLKALGKSVI